MSRNYLIKIYTYKEIDLILSHFSPTLPSVLWHFPFPSASPLIPAGFLAQTNVNQNEFVYPILI